MTHAVLRAMEPARDELVDRRHDFLERLPDPSQMDLPSLELLGRRADEAVDRLRGRSRRPAWPWLVGSLVVVGVAIAAASAVISWSRARTAETWPDDALDGLDADLRTTPASTTGLTAVEGSLMSYDPTEARGA